jgi:hypothetical protein
MTYLSPIHYVQDCCTSCTRAIMLLEGLGQFK